MALGSYLAMGLDARRVRDDRLLYGCSLGTPRNAHSAACKPVDSAIKALAGVDDIDMAPT